MYEALTYLQLIDRLWKLLGAIENLIEYPDTI